MFEKLIIKIADFYYLLTCKNTEYEDTKKQVQRVLKKININPSYYKDLHYSLKKSEEVLTFVIKKDYTLLEFAPSILKDTKSFMKKASAKIQRDRFFILDLVAKNPSVFKHIRREFKNDSEIAITAITPKLYATKEEKQKSASMYKHASSTLRANEGFIRHCLHVNPYVKKYVKSYFFIFFNPKFQYFGLN